MLTEENLRRFRVDLAVLGADALRPEGLFTTDTEIARVSQSMLVAAERAVVVADSSKFADSAFVRFADWYHVHEVVTDAGIPDEARGWLAEKEVELTVVPAAEPAPERSNA
jgi:DeoR/GlpR family transcriptional regulator of sugar metabolism